MNVGSEFHKRPGASEDLLNRTLIELDAPLPEDYSDFMRQSNGGSGFIAGKYLALSPLEELAALNHTFKDVDDVSEIVWFGGNGGGEAFGFDWSDDGAIVEGPMIGMERKVLLHCAKTFTEFLKNPTGFKE